MKKFVTLSFLLLVSTLMLASTTAFGGQDREVKFTVEKMTCAACPITVRKAMQRVDGVKDVSVDFDSKTATVIYDAEMTNAQKIGKSSAMVGFPASVIEDDT